MTQYETFKDGIGIGTLESQKGAIETIQEDSPIQISGVAIPENTILRGGQGVEHFFSPEMAQRAAQVLEAQIEEGETVHLVKGFHDTEGQADADQVIGEITGAGYSKGIGVVFEGETIDETTAQKINNGYVDISPSIARSLGEMDEQMQARTVDDVAGFRDIAVVARGQEGSDVTIGSNPAVEALNRNVSFDPLEDTETEDDESEPMSLDEAKETIAEEYEIDAETLEEKLTEDDEPKDENVVTLITE